MVDEMMQWNGEHYLAFTMIALRIAIIMFILFMEYLISISRHTG